MNHKLDLEITETDLDGLPYDDFVLRNRVYRTAYGPRLRVGFKTEGVSLTKQSERDFCDINHIIARHRKTGLLDHVNTMSAMYGDFTNIPDYQEALQVVQTANDLFNGLPSEIRSQFGNDPKVFLDFVSDEANRDACIKLGLFADPDAPPAAQPSADPPAEPPPAGDPLE